MMADYWTQGSFAFQCIQAERALLDEAFAAAQLLCRGEDAGEPSSALLAAVPPQAGGPPWGGFVTLFPDPEFPHFGAVLASEAVADDPSCAEIVISGAEAFELEAIAAVVQRCCAETLAKKPIGFEWADSCRSEEHTSELQSLMRNSYAVFCLKKKK